MDGDIQEGLFANQALLYETIQDTRQEIGESLVSVGEIMDEMSEIIYGEEAE
jgi:hypothetical protein